MQVDLIKNGDDMDIIITNDISAKKELIFDTSRCTSTLLVYDNEKSQEQLLNAFDDTEIPDIIDMIYIKKGEDANNLMDTIDTNYNNGVTTYLFLESIDLLSNNILEIVRFIKDGSLRTFTFVPSSKVDNSGNLTAYKYRALNSNFNVQNVMFFDDNQSRVYNTQTYYNKQNKKRVL